MCPCVCVWCMVYSCICALWAGQSSCVWSYQEHCMAIIYSLPLFIDETTISGSQLHHLPLHHQDSSDLLLTADPWAECETCWFLIKFTTTMSSKGTNSYTLDTYSHYLTWLVKLSTGWFNQFNLKLFTETIFFMCNLSAATVKVRMIHRTLCSHFSPISWPYFLFQLSYLIWYILPLAVQALSPWHSVTAVGAFLTSSKQWWGHSC